ncbi:MAG: glycoside hydrolase family 3 protein [Alphaproteobacteria bacterium]|nr:glycoside hydrolase family 3 protein [Alphaproteobacteria bacterium]
MASSAAAQSADAVLDDMAGQMILVGFAGDSVADTRALADMIGEGRLGGIMYLKPNVADLDTVKRMNAAFVAARPDLPPFIALDQEGGSVERLTKAVGFAEIPSAGEVARNTDALGAEAIYLRMARSLKSYGFNLNFGPVVDLALNPDNPVIAKYGRAFGADPDDVVRYAEAFVGAHRQAGILTALKHFPGHGSSAADSHEGFVDITGTLEAKELDPFRRMISRGEADMVMVAHLYHAKFGVDPVSQQPASLNPSWIEGTLRDQLGFDGVVITDDLEMGAIRKRFTLEQSVLAAVRAGVDILLFSNTADPRLGLADEVRGILVAEAERDPAFRDRIVESHARIVALKNGHL